VTTTCNKLRYCQPLRDASRTSHSKPACTASTVPKGLPRPQSDDTGTFLLVSRCSVTTCGSNPDWRDVACRWKPIPFLQDACVDGSRPGGVDVNAVCWTHHAVHPQLEADCTTTLIIMKLCHTASSLAVHSGIDWPYWSGASGARSEARDLITHIVVDSRPSLRSQPHSSYYRVGEIPRPTSSVYGAENNLTEQPITAAPNNSSSVTRQEFAS